MSVIERPVVKQRVTAEGVHIVPDGRFDEDDPFEKVTALCGVVAHVYRDGRITPDGFDFYLFGAVGYERATCRHCRAAARLLA